MIIGNFILRHILTIYHKCKHTSSDFSNFQQLSYSFQSSKCFKYHKSGTVPIHKIVKYNIILS